MKINRILIVEEEKNVRDVIFTMLARMGYQVEIACSGEEGLELFQKGNFDLVLSDLTMPLMDGWELASLLKEKSPHIPFCLMTGWGEKEIRPMIRESAVDFVMFKPFRLRKVQEAVERMLEYTG